MPVPKITYSEPTIARTSTESVIEFDSVTPTWSAWESLRITREDDGTVEISGRGEGPVQIPAPILPLVLAEIDRILSADDEVPLAPFAPIVATRDVPLGYIPGIADGDAA